MVPVRLHELDANCHSLSGQLPAEVTVTQRMKLEEEQIKMFSEVAPPHRGALVCPMDGVVRRFLRAHADRQHARAACTCILLLRERLHPDACAYHSRARTHTHTHMHTHTGAAATQWAAQDVDRTCG